MNKHAIISAAKGDSLPDLVLKGATIVNVFTEQLQTADVAVADGFIVGIGSYKGRREIDLSGKILVPGFIDAHMHLESSLITPREYERAVLPRGTTAVIADPHELANVAGTEGIDFLMSASADLMMHVYFTLSSCVPSSPLEEPGHTLNAASLRPYYERSNVVGLAEVMDFPGVISEDADLMQKIADAEACGKNVDGHAPALSGPGLCAYIAAGIATDHECSSAAEAVEKLGLGQWIMIREGTAAKNLEALLPLCKEPYCQRCVFVTDDRHPEDLLHEGHMDAIIRKSVSLGVSPITAIKMCTYNTARCFGLKRYGAIAPGYRADMAVIGSLKDIDVQQVFIGGEHVALNGSLCSETKRSQSRCGREEYPAVWNSFHMSAVTPECFEIKEFKRRLRIIGLVPHELLTEEIIEEITPEQLANNGIDTSKDIIKAAVMERHHHTDHIGIGFLKGYGLKKGAIAASVAHDAHNLITAGTNHIDMAIAAERVRTLGGGMVVAAQGQILAELALPIGGIISDQPLEQVDAAITELKKAASELGVSGDIDPFMTLGFTSLPVIPKLRLNGRGLIDVERMQIVDVTLD